MPEWEKKSRLHHSLEWYTRVYTTRDYAITYLFHDRRARANLGQGQLGPMFSTYDKLFTLGNASVEWVMGRYLTPDNVLRDMQPK